MEHPNKWLIHAEQIFIIANVFHCVVCYFPGFVGASVFNNMFVSSFYHFYRYWNLSRTFGVMQFDGILPLGYGLSIRQPLLFLSIVGSMRIHIFIFMTLFCMKGSNLLNKMGKNVHKHISALRNMNIFRRKSSFLFIFFFLSFWFNIKLMLPLFIVLWLCFIPFGVFSVLEKQLRMVCILASDEISQPFWVKKKNSLDYNSHSFDKYYYYHMLPYSSLLHYIAAMILCCWYKFNRIWFDIRFSDEQKEINWTDAIAKLAKMVNLDVMKGIKAHKP